MKESFIIVGLRVEKYIGDTVSGSNCHFTYTPEEKERSVILMVREKDQQKFELTLWTVEGECGSGWCAATYGNAEYNEVSLFACKTHTCKPFMIDIDIDSTSDIELTTPAGSVFAKCSYFGGCNYYPSGGSWVNTDIFSLGGVIDEDAIRHFKKRPVLIFYGDSNACKSHIAALTGKTVFETDSVDTIPDNITEDIIVIGNRHGYDIDDVKWNIHSFTEANIIEVHFKHSDM